MSVDGLIVSGVAGGGVLGGARPVVVTDDVIVVIAAVVLGVHGDPSVVVDDLGGDRLPTSEGDLDELLLVLLVVGDDGAAAEAVDALGVVALVL